MVVNKIIKKVKEQHLIKKYIIFIVIMFIAAINFNLLINPSKIVAGGVNGLAILFEDFLNLNPSYFIFIFSFIILIVSIFVLGPTKASSILLFTFIYPFFVKITSGVTDYIIFEVNDLLLFSIFIGVITGIVNGICYKIGLGAGPIPLISQIFNKLTKMPLSKITFILNGLIIIIGAYRFGTENVLYAIITIYINSIVIDKILLGISSNKTMYIITSQHDKIKKYITEELNKGVTLIEGEGAYQDQKKVILMTVVSSSDYFRIKEKIKLLDSNTFFIVTDSYELSGGV